MSIGRAFLLLVLSCGVPASRDVEAELASADRAELEQRAATARLHVDVAALIAEYESNEHSYATAAAAFAQAKIAATDAAQSYSEAEKNFGTAARNLRWMMYVVIVAATYDFAGEICDGVETTQQYRRRLGLVGNTGLCVDHSFAHALGGINHRWNYVPLDCRVNSAYGAAFAGKLADMPLEVLRGLAVSAVARLRCGGSPSAWSR